MNLEGRLRITLAHDAGAVRGVHIASSRPLAAVRVLRGKTPQQVLSLLPLLFNVCGNAQAFAAQQACLQALGTAAETATISAGLLLVQLETLREHCWRILLDWPGLLGLQADKKRLAPLLRCDARFKPLLFEGGAAFRLDSRVNADFSELARHIDALDAFVDTAIFEGGLASWRGIATERELIAWARQNDSLPAQLLREVYRKHWQEIGRNSIGLLPEIDAAELEMSMPAADLENFCRTPNWRGCCYETTVLNRQQTQPLVQVLAAQYGNGLLTRTVARLLEVSRLPDSLRHCLARLHPARLSGAPEDHAGKPAASAGWAQVQAARGLLLHRVQLEQGVVKAYHIVAPTEWNFHPGGVAAAGLKQLRALHVDELQRQAEWLMQAIDPCVAYEILLHDENG